jgi:hypothetical protein
MRVAALPRNQSHVLLRVPVPGRSLPLLHLVIATRSSTSFIELFSSEYMGGSSAIMPPVTSLLWRARWLPVLLVAVYAVLLVVLALPAVQTE